MFRTVCLTLIAAALVLCWRQLYDEHIGWAITVSGDSGQPGWEIVARGLSVVWHCWALFLLGLSLGLLLMPALRRCRNSFEHRIREEMLQDNEEQFQKRFTELDNREKALVRRQAAVDCQVAQANKERDEARKRCSHAVGAAERLKRKMERLRKN